MAIDGCSSQVEATPRSHHRLSGQFFVAREVPDGLIGIYNPDADSRNRFKHIIQMATGTVLDPGEAVTSERVLEAAGHTGALMFHSTYERGGAESIPGAADYTK